MARNRGYNKTSPDSIDYLPMLRQWSRELRDSALTTELNIPAGTLDWLGSRPADQETVAAAEARLGIALPPSYRQFLLTSDGWGPLSCFVHRLRDCAWIDWYLVENANSVDAWSDTDDGGLPDMEYFQYENETPTFRGKHLRHTLQISDGGDGDLLLNPCAVTLDGEWECWFLASWIPGARRYVSFAHWLVAEYRSFRQVQRVGSANPVLTKVTIPPPTVHRKAIRPKRSKPPRRSTEELILEMMSADNATRSKAVKVFAGQLTLRGGAKRRPELIEPLTALFHASPHADVRALCIQMITQVMPDGPTPVAIIEAFADSDPWVVLSGIWARHYFDVRAAFDKLCRFVDTTDNLLCKDSAVSALGELGDPRAIPVLARVLRNREQQFDQHLAFAALALAKLGSEAIPHLVDASRDEDVRIRMAAVVGFQEIDNRAAVKHLEKMLTDADATVRTRAEVALRIRGVLPKA